MKKNLRTSLILLALLCSWSACKKQLNVFPSTAQADGNLIKDHASAQLVLNGVYYRFAAVHDPTEMDWVAVNEEYPSLLAGTLMNRSYSSTLYTHELSPDDFYIPAIWNYLYNLVNAANGFIENMTPVNVVAPPVKQQMLAEARFLRAFANEELLLYFGQYNDLSSEYGIILRDTVVGVTNVKWPRSAVADAYTSILSDLNTAIQGLPALSSSICYANASTAKLLKARVLMNRGAAGDYAEVISLTGDIIANSPFALEDSVKDLFLTKGFVSKEVMLGVQPPPMETNKFDTYQGGFNGVPGDSLLPLLADDARNQWIYKSVDDTYNGPFNEWTKYYSGDPLNIDRTPLSTNCYAFRLSEAWLLQAEAITLSTGDLSTAKTLLKTVMFHAGAGPSGLAAVAAASTPAALQLEIVKENLRSFTGENGVDWFALRRLPLATIQRFNPRITSPTQLILPIPSTELKYNPVIQNPGY